MSLNRRQLLILTAAAAAGCAGPGSGGDPLANRPRADLNIGPESDYAADGVYDRFRDRGLFIIRRNGRLLAISSICTHKYCKLSVSNDQSFYCKCHDSTFDREGHVTLGPARRDLPGFAVVKDEAGNLIVKGVPA